MGGPQEQKWPRICSNSKHKKVLIVTLKTFHRELAISFAVYISVLIRQRLNCHVSRKVETIPGMMPQDYQRFPGINFWWEIQMTDIPGTVFLPDSHGLAS